LLQTGLVNMFVTEEAFVVPQIRELSGLSSCSTLDRRMTLAMDSEDDVPVSPATSATPESLLIDRFSNNAVLCAIEQLPVIFREVILLCDVEDATYREIAEILSIPMGTVMSRLARARKAVRDSLRGTAGGPISSHLSHKTERNGNDTEPLQSIRI